MRVRFELVADQLLEEFGDNQQHQEFIEYMENTWIGRPRRIPFSLNKCGIRRISQNLTSRELQIQWNHGIGLQNTFGCLHPNFFRFMDGILNENIRTNALCVKLDAGEEVIF